MSFSDLILACVVIAGAAIIVWVLDINPYSKQIQIYSQTCDNMILDNTYCKGNWEDNPVQTFKINLQDSQIIHIPDNQSDSITYNDCSIQDSKNWTCVDELNEQTITVKDGMLAKEEKSDVQQITRLKWLQNKLLEFVS